MPSTQHSVSLPERYRVTRRIASGGMATVYACEDQVLGRLVAVKVLAPAYSSDKDALARFQREGRAVAKVSDHPNVVTIYDIGEHEGSAFIVMEYFAGGTVADRLRDGDPVPRPTALRWLQETASALDHAHQAGIVHRDVKPPNLLLDANGRLAVGDFGIARMATDVGVTSTGMVLGTAAYLSPEQAMGQRATAASDRYALSVVAFELLTRRRPFGGEHPAAQARAHIESSPPAASEIDHDLDPEVDHVLWRGLEKDPERRWPTACAMVEALDDALGEKAEPRSIGTAPTAPVRRRAQTASTSRRSWGPVLLAALLAGLLIGAVVAAFIGSGGGGGTKQAATPPVAKKAKPKAQTPAPATSSQPAQSTTQPPASDDKSPSQLQAEGHSLIDSGDYDAAIAKLQQATKDCPVSQTNPCAYALYDLGHALRLGGRPQEAIPVLEQRLQNPDQHGAVEKELRAAQKDAGVKPGKGPKKAKEPKD